MKVILIITIILLVMVGVSWVNYNYVWSYGFMGSDYCKVLGTQGYFENEYDVADHKNCTIGLKEGPDQCNFLQKKILSEERKQNCFEFDYYDDECEKNIDMQDYGKRCTWMSLGYMATMFSMLLWFIVAFNILLLVLELRNIYRSKND